MESVIPQTNKNIANFYYGIQWKPKPKDQIQTKKIAKYNTLKTASGIYICFQVIHLDDTYLVDETENKLYGKPSTEAEELFNFVDNNILSDFNNTQQLGSWEKLKQRVLQLKTFMEYTSSCLAKIYDTENGKLLIKKLNKKKQNRPVFIVPSCPTMGNSIQTLSDQCFSKIANLMLGSQLFTRETNKEVIKIIRSKYKSNKDVNNLNLLAKDINNMPLYSQFIKEENFSSNFLGQYLKYQEKPIDGTVLSNWLLDKYSGKFCDFLKTNQIEIDEVMLVKYFRLAMIVALYNFSPPGKGSPSKVAFRTFINNNDRRDLNRLRPPEIGLAHELIHAFHNAYGSQPGKEIYDFSTVLAELLCVGLGPFSNQPITENLIRQSWNDKYKTNVDKREVYELAKNKKEVLDFRRLSKTY